MNGNFTFYNPTKIYFGKDSISNLKNELLNYGKNILLVYGGGSIKRTGIYDKVISILKEVDKNIFELPNVLPNPLYTKVLEGARMVRDNSIDLILAVGGGSVIDCSKGISASSYCLEEDPYQKYWINQKPVDTKVVPVASILTMVGTGSEMNGGSVITNEELKLKKGRVFGPNLYPKFSILDPTYTLTVSEYQMKSGIFDTLSHLMEQYFSGNDENVSDYLIEGLMRSLISNAKVACKDPQNYQARSNIMWIATLALNTLVGLGKTQDWEVHSIEHQLGAYTNCAHGMGLAAISIPYYKFVYKYGLDKFAQFATNVWMINPDKLSKEELAIKGLEALENFIKDCGMVTSIKELGATKDMLKDIADSCDLGGGYYTLTHEDILKILESCF